MGDEHEAHARVFLQLHQKLEDLRLDGDVEGGGRFVRNQQLRTAGDGHGDHHALVHAARELMREREETLLRRRNADEVE